MHPKGKVVGSNPTGGTSVTCKTGHSSYKKHFLGLSDNVTYFAEQLEAAPANVYNYRVTFKPEAFLPDFDVRTSMGK